MSFPIPTPSIPIPRRSPLPEFYIYHSLAFQQFSHTATSPSTICSSILRTSDVFSKWNCSAHLLFWLAFPPRYYSAVRLSWCTWLCFFCFHCCPLLHCMKVPFLSVDICHQQFASSILQTSCVCTPVLHARVPLMCSHTNGGHGFRVGHVLG